MSEKIKIQEVAAEAGMKNNEMLEKAKEMGLDVKVAHSSITPQEAEMLMDYALTGNLPSAKKTTSTKKQTTKIRKVNKSVNKEETKTSETSSDSSKETTSKEIKEVESPKKEEKVKVQEEEKQQTEKEEPKKKAPMKRKGITATAKNDTVDVKKAPKKAPLRKGITIVKKARPDREIKKVQKKTPSLSKQNITPSAPKKKKKKTPASAKVTGSKLEIMGDRDLGGSIELFEEQEVVLLDFSDKNIYEEQQRQEKKRREEAKKRAAMGVRSGKGFTPQNQHRPIKRGGKRKKYPTKTATENEKVSVVKIPEDVRVYEFAEKIGKSVGEVVKVLFTLGTMVTKNDFLDKDSIEILAEEFGVEVQTINPLDELDYVNAYDEIPNSVEEPRPPVITIMGHVDHGKTSLLDKIRSTKVTAQEAGGITQHVGAYQIEKNGQKITFIDTPGHSAFTEMRARGAQATDIAIIVVAADDGVMPQTKESISHAQAAGVPIIIAVNKIDKPTANIDNVKSQLAEIGILSIDWGGDYEFVPVSAHSGEGIDDLLETILLQAELMELTADPTRKAKAIVIESSVEKGFGAVANVIIKNGTLNVGDNVIVGTTYGRVRTLILDNGDRAKSIGPSTPAAVVGLHEVPQAGEVLIGMDSEKEAKELADKRKEYARAKELSKSTRVTLDELGSLIAEGKIKKLPLIVKADVQGSLEAIRSALGDLKNEEVKVEVIHAGVGGITESDVVLADASENSIIVGFNVRPTGSVKNKARDLGVEIKTYSIIYDLLDDIKALLGGLMSPVITEEVTGQAEVRETFTVAKVGTIAGCMVTDGTIIRNAGARVIRNGVVVYTSKISSLKRFSEDAKEVRTGFECGIMMENFNDIKVGDVIETFKEVEEQATL